VAELVDVQRGEPAQHPRAGRGDAQPDHALIDGLPVFPFPLPQTAIVDGDCYSLSIAAASVIAKVTRDMMMRDFCARFPEYCFSQHKGYGTELHLLKLHAHGPCPIHRRSFEPVAQPLFAFARRVVEAPIAHENHDGGEAFVANESASSTV
jgi:ribonuclease HII